MNRYFLAADIMGFKEIVRNSSVAQLNARVAQWIAVVEAAKREAKIESIQLISDTVFAATDHSADGLRSLVQFAKQLLDRGCPQSFPIRGAITSGDVNWTPELVYGSAVIEAHILESAQNWIGIACAANLPHAAEVWKPSNLICYPIPMKDGPIRLFPAVNWEVPSFNDLVKFSSSGGLVNAGQTFVWSWGQKITNTIEFKIYRDRTIESGGDITRFIPRIPIELLE